MIVFYYSYTLKIIYCYAFLLAIFFYIFKQMIQPELSHPVESSGAASLNLLGI